MNVFSFLGAVRFRSVIIAVMLQVFVQGCVAYQFSTPGLLKQDDSVPVLQRLVLGVEVPNNKERSYNLEKFVDNLKTAGVFKAVGYLADGFGLNYYFENFSLYIKFEKFVQSSQMG